MSALGDYYRAQTAEKIAGIPLQQAQAFNAQATGQGIQLQNSQIVPNAQSQRDEQAARAGLNTAEAGATRAKLPGEIDATAANTALTNTRAALLPGESAAQIGSQDASTQATLQGLQANNGALFGALSQLPGFGSLFGQKPPAATSTTNTPIVPTKAVPGVVGFAKGTSHVKAKGPKAGSTDTVPAMLSPGEAVLNRGAAEHMGRGVIDHLNKHGLLRMAAQHEVSKHMAHLAKSAGPKGKPKAGTVLHFMTGGMVPGQPGIAPGAGQGPDLMSMLAATMGAPAPGAGGAPGGAPAAPAAPSPRPRTAHKGKR